MKTFTYPRQRKAMLKAFSETESRSDAKVDAVVRKIIFDIRVKGDPALFGYTKAFDRVTVTPKSIRIEPAVCKRAWDQLPKPLAAALEYAAEGIRTFHHQQLRTGYTITRAGVKLEQRIRPLRSAGVYVPGGQAVYPSTLLMNVIPAQIAGVRNIVVATPPIKGDPQKFVPLAAAHLLGIGDCIYQVGGAQAIAALAYGTTSVPKVDKVVGPGNAYVAAAKRMLYGIIDIESVAGESEVLIIADASARPDYIAADLLAQAEHTGGETVVLVGIGSSFDFDAVKAELKRQLASAPRRKQAENTLKNGGFFIRVDTADEAAEVANLKAPEHLEIIAADAEAIADRIDNVGAIFLGEFTPEPVGDYVAGPNHVLPTGGTARFFSPLGVDAFLKASNVLRYDEAALREAAPHVIELAECEGLQAHAEAVRVRLNGR